MQPRDVSRLDTGPFDLLVVGGGIHGLTTAYEAASRGLRTALIEAGDFGSGISFNHQKTAHGGLRSLQSLRLDRAREAIRERRALARIAPWFLHPMPFIVGTYRSLAKGRLALRAGFRFDAWLGRNRNEGIERELHLPRAKLLSRGMTLKLFPGINERNLTGGAQWYDYQMAENDRLTLAFAAAADAHGAVLANYVEATAALLDGGRVVGMTATDRESGQALTIRAALTINAAGARAAEVSAMFGAPLTIPLVGAMNLVASSRAREVALAAPAAAGRMLTLIPWRGRAIVGTGHSAAVLPAGAMPATGDIDAFIAEANEAFPALKLTRADISLVHWGLVPASTAPGKAPDLLSAPVIHDHAASGTPGAMTIVGVKYTTARAVAERAVDLAGKRLGKHLRRSATAAMILPGAGFADHEGLAIETARRSGIDVAPPVLARLSALYGERAAHIVALIAEQPSLGEPLAPGTAATAAEILHVIRHEQAIHLTDIVLRRTTLGAAGHPGVALLAACARVTAAELGWNAEREAAEIAAVERVYDVP